MMDIDRTYSRRGVLKVGLFGGFALAGAGLLESVSGCSTDRSAEGFQQLRQSDLPMLRRLTPIMLAGAVPASDASDAAQAALASLDEGLGYLSPAVLRQIRQLFDLLSLSLTRGPFTGIWSSWELAKDAEIHAFLERWENSSIALLRQGHAALQQMILMAWYGRRESWPHCGYPGPPAI